MADHCEACEGPIAGATIGVPGLIGTFQIERCDQCERFNTDDEATRHFWDLVVHAPKLAKALEGLFEHCSMIHKHWGDGCNRQEADAAIKFARELLKIITKGRKPVSV